MLVIVATVPDEVDPLVCVKVSVDTVVVEELEVGILVIVDTVAELDPVSLPELEPLPEPPHVESLPEIVDVPATVTCDKKLLILHSESDVLFVIINPSPILVKLEKSSKLSKASLFSMLKYRISDVKLLNPERSTSASSLYMVILPSDDS